MGCLPVIVKPDGFETAQAYRPLQQGKFSSSTLMPESRDRRRSGCSSREWHELYYRSRGMAIRADKQLRCPHFGS